MSELLGGVDSALFLAVTVPLALWRPRAGLYAYLFLLLARPHDVVGALAALRPMLVLGAVTVASASWRLRNRPTEGVEALRPFLPFLAAVALSTLFGGEVSASASAANDLLQSVLIAWLVVLLARTRVEIAAISWLAAASHTLLAAVLVCRVVLGGRLAGFRNLNYGGIGSADPGQLGDENSLASLLLLTLPLLWFLAAQSRVPWQRALAALGVVVTVAGIVLSYSRAGLVGLGVAALCIVFAGPRPQRGAALLAGAAALLLLLLPSAYIGFLVRTALEPGGQMRGRLVIWNVAGELLKERPLLGSGPGTFEIRYGRQIPGAPRAGHNWILEFLVELGGVGLLAFGWMMGRPLVRLYGLRGPPDRATDPWLAAVATGLGASLAAHLAFHLFHSGALAAQAFVVLGLAVAVSRLGEEGTSRP